MLKQFYQKYRVACVALLLFLIPATLAFCGCVWVDSRNAVCSTAVCRLLACYNIIVGIAAVVLPVGYLSAEYAKD